MGQNMLWIWLAVFAFCLIVELIDSGTLVSVWFSVGAVIPLLMSFYRTNNVWYWVLQIVIFGIVSALCLIFLRKIAVKVFYKNSKEKTNMDIYKGKSYKIERISNDVAYIKINGVEYQVTTEKEDAFMTGEKVSVIKFEGNKIIVTK